MILKTHQHHQHHQIGSQNMGLSNLTNTNADDQHHEEEALLLKFNDQPPKDTFNLAYIIYFTLSTGYLLPWNAFITAVDYFAYLYPDASIDRVFAAAYLVPELALLSLIILFAHKSSSRLRINIGLAIFLMSLVVVPLIDLLYIKGRTGLYEGFYVTVAVFTLAGQADALVQSGIIGSAGELPERYMQAVIAGVTASGVIVDVLRLITKAVYPQDGHGLRKSAFLYFAVSIVGMVNCIVLYNVVGRLPVIKYYKNLKMQAVNKEKNEKGSMTGTLWRSTLWDTIGRVKWFGIGIIVINIVTTSINPGFLTEDVYSSVFKDWYPILLLTCSNVLNLVGKCITALYVLENSKVSIGGCFARLVFYPLFWGCMHGPRFFRTEIPVIFLTCLLCLTDGYLASVLMIVAPKTVQIQHSETAAMVMVLFQALGLAIGSGVAWFWVI